MSDLKQRIAEGLELYAAAERDWEFHDASAAFNSFMHWIEDNFSDLLSALQPDTDTIAEAMVKYLQSRNLSICNFSRNGAGFWPVNDEMAAARAAVNAWMGEQ